MSPARCQKISDRIITYKKLLSTYVACIWSFPSRHDAFLCWWHTYIFGTISYCEANLCKEEHYASEKLLGRLSYQSFAPINGMDTSLQLRESNVNALSLNDDRFSGRLGRNCNLSGPLLCMLAFTSHLSLTWDWANNCVARDYTEWHMNASSSKIILFATKSTSEFLGFICPYSSGLTCWHGSYGMAGSCQLCLRRLVFALAQFLTTTHQFVNGKF